MIRRSIVLSAAAVTLALGGCSGSSSPTPTPTPTPPPTPTPTPTYSSFPVTAATEFGTIDAFTSWTGDLAAGPVTLGAAGTESSGTRFRLAMQPDPTAATSALPVVVLENTEVTGGRFDSTMLTTPPSTTNNEYIFNYTFTAPLTAGQFSTAEFLNNTTNNTTTAKITTDSLFSTLTRVSYAGWIRGDSTTAGHRISYGTWGYPTIAGTTSTTGDMPTTGTATYTAKLAGRAVGVTGGTGTLSKLGGTVTITVNFATGLVSFTANVTTVAGGVETPYGTYSGTGALGAGAVQFIGSFGTSSPIPGTIAGSFYGSQGEQIGITFAGSGTIGATDTRIVGAIVGKKN